MRSALIAGVSSTANTNANRRPIHHTTRGRRGIARARSARGPLSASKLDDVLGKIPDFCSVDTSEADIELGARARAMDRGELHAAQHAVEAAPQRAGGLAVHLHPVHPPARPVDD